MNHNPAKDRRERKSIRGKTIHEQKKPRSCRIKEGEVGKDLLRSLHKGRWRRGRSLFCKSVSGHRLGPLQVELKPEDGIARGAHEQEGLLFRSLVAGELERFGRRQVSITVPLECLE